MKFLIPILVVGAVIYIVNQGGFSHEFSSLAVPSTAASGNNGAAPLSSFSQALSSFVGASTTTAGDNGAAHYSPTENLEVIDAADIANSPCDHLDIAMYSFTDWKIAAAVIQYANRGHLVRIYRDHEQYQQEAQRKIRVIAMFRGNRNISIRVKSSMVLMHVKSWSDGCTLRDGSANWSPSGELQQDNTLTLTANRQAVMAFEAKFNQMWTRTDNITVQ